MQMVSQRLDRVVQRRGLVPPPLALRSVSSRTDMHHSRAHLIAVPHPAVSGLRLRQVARRQHTVERAERSRRAAHAETLSKTQGTRDTLNHHTHAHRSTHNAHIRNSDILSAHKRASRGAYREWSPASPKERRLSPSQLNERFDTSMHSSRPSPKYVHSSGASSRRTNVSRPPL